MNIEEDISACDGRVKSDNHLFRSVYTISVCVRRVCACVGALCVCVRRFCVFVHPV